MQKVVKPAAIKSTRIKKILFVVVGILFLSWVIFTPDGLLGKADAVGYAVCHRIPNRSFVIGERPFPLCARCSGMYLGALLGLIYQSFISWKAGLFPPRRVTLVLGIFVLIFAIDGLNSFLSLIPFAPTLYIPQNWLRLISGTVMGVVIAASLYPVFHQTMWKDWIKMSSIAGINSLIGLIGILIILILILMKGTSYVLYSLALISSVGVLIVLTVIYTILWTILLKSENRYNSINEIAIPVTAGFGTAILQLIVFSTIRYTLTGTWHGFNF
jgi:uncharacterized membrane protein